MGIKDDLKHYITISGWNLTKVTEELNKRNNTHLTIQNLSKKINNETLRYSDVLQIAEIIGYKLVWEKVNDTDIDASDTPKDKATIIHHNKVAELFNGSGIISDGIKKQFVETYKKQLQEDLFKAFVENYIIPDDDKNK